MFRSLHSPSLLRNLSFTTTRPLSCPAGQHLTSVQYPYFVPRNTRGNLPVYTDIRNAGSRYITLIRNVDGNATLLAKDLAYSLFEPNSPELQRIKVDIVRGKHLVITGGDWKHQIVDWLKEKGF